MDSMYEAPLLDPATFTWDLRLYRSVVLAGLVLLIYDHTLTLATEVKFIWAAKLRPSIYWFIALRYIGLLANIANCVLYFAELSLEVRVPFLSSVQALNDIFSEVCIRIDISSFVLKLPHSSCVKMQIMWKVLLVIQETLVECTLIMRVFAMYGRNWRILICLLAVFALFPALALVVGYYRAGTTADILRAGDQRVCFDNTANIDLSTCGGLGVTNRLRHTCLAVAYLERETYPRYAGTLMWRMTTDGAGYFCIIIIANVANLATFYLGDVNMSLPRYLRLYLRSQIFLSGFLSWLITSLSIMLLARLMLNLHEAAAVGMTNEGPTTIELETLRFATEQMTVEDGA
ncbi:hypothetical protein K438DRAFT_2000155 [Mycena galopus ATCC 62051]|nr:hypothetical protein K438DRAFT_2000155 [Mycena galopus ATCC 62051]